MVSKEYTSKILGGKIMITKDDCSYIEYRIGELLEELEVMK